MSTPDEDDELSRQATVLANAEELGREHSARREVRLRDERVRRLSSTEGSRESRERESRERESRESREREPREREREPRERKGSGSLKGKKRESTAEESSRRKTSPSASKGSRSNKSRPATSSRSKDPLERSHAKSGSLGRDETGSNPRLSDPFPPIKKQANKGAKKQATPPPDRAPEPAPTSGSSPAADVVNPRSPPRPGGPYRDIGPSASTSDLLAMELEELVRRMRLGFRQLGAGDRITLLTSLLVVLGTLMPWVSFPGQPLLLGIFSGGVIHLALSIAAIRYVLIGFAQEFEVSPAEAQRRRSRHSLYIVLLGALSTVFGAYLLLRWGAQKSNTYPIIFHYGLYWTLACGTGVSYGGFARFGTGGPR